MELSSRHMIESKKMISWPHLLDLGEQPFPAVGGRAGASVPPVLFQPSCSTLSL